MEAADVEPTKSFLEELFAAEVENGFDERELLQIPTQAIERGLRPNPRERNAPQR